MIYGQAVVGAPGAGKTTYCNGMQQYLRLLGRNACVLNLDPANENIPGERSYDALWDVTTKVIHLRRVMQDLELGPNGGLLYCMEYLNEHTDEWITQVIDEISKQETPPYLLIDLPGQSEVYTHGTAVAQLLQKLVKRLSLRLTVIQLMDATLCRDATQFLSATVISLATMVRLEQPTVSVLSKSDLLLSASPDDLLFDVEFFLDCHNLHQLVDFIDGCRAFSETDVDISEDQEYQMARRATKSSTFRKKHRRLFEGLSEVVEDYGLLHFEPLDISNAASVGQLLQRIDRCNGHIFVSGNTVQEDLFQVAMQANENRFETISQIQERLQPPPNGS